MRQISGLNSERSSCQAWSAPKWTPQNCKWCVENRVLATVMECFCVWVFSLFERELLGGVGGSRDLFCFGFSDSEVAVVQYSSSPLPAVPVNSTSPSSIRVFDPGDNGSFLDVGVFQNVARLNQKQLKRKNWESTYMAKFFSAVTMSGSHIWPDRLIFSTLRQS